MLAILKSSTSKREVLTRKQRSIAERSEGLVLLLAPKIYCFYWSLVNKSQYSRHQL